MRDRRRGGGVGAREARRALAESFSQRNLATPENQRVESNHGQTARVFDHFPTLHPTPDTNTRATESFDRRPAKGSFICEPGRFSSLCKVRVAGRSLPTNSRRAALSRTRGRVRVMSLQ